VTDEILKLREQAIEDPSALKPLLIESQLGPISDEAALALEKRPQFEPTFLEKQAQKFGLPFDQVHQIAQEVVAQGSAALVVERHQFGLESEAREHLAALYEKQIKVRRTCNRWLYAPVENPKAPGKYRRARKPCGYVFETFDEALVHHSLHILFEADYRTQRAHWNDILNIKYPLEQKTLRAALTVEERRRMMADHRLRERLRVDP
jgi:hypothetical protein